MKTFKPKIPATKRSAQVSQETDEVKPEAKAQEAWENEIVEELTKARAEVAKQKNEECKTKRVVSPDDIISTTLLKKLAKLRPTTVAEWKEVVPNSAQDYLADSFLKVINNMLPNDPSKKKNRQPPAKRAKLEYVSPTLNNGIQFKSEYDSKTKKFKDLTWTGDMLWGRRGRYPTSFFVHVRMYYNAVQNETYESALIKLQQQFDLVKSWSSDIDEELLKRLKQDPIDNTQREEAIQQMINELRDGAKNLKEEEKIKKNIEELAKMILDLQVHSPIAFIHCEPAPESVIQKQRESAAMLAAYEKKMGGK
eukprot:TRINITY_DN21852_c0_g1_i1.p1 TRINITY_DN21852_c0_g1~~TRINITY_DN21852_c0_g1_i1.p1  ORF type:complete len:309 (-),score=84.33 TRINITY_DN21852_c0_g1_i1:18-944(-)